MTTEGDSVLIPKEQFDGMINTINQQGAELERIQEFLKPKLYKRETMREDIKDALKRYAEHKIMTGDFLKAVLENDLQMAFARADEDNVKDMLQIVRYCYNDLPSECWGSKEKVEAWLTKKET